MCDALGSKGNLWAGWAWTHLGSDVLSQEFHCIHYKYIHLSLQKASGGGSLVLLVLVWVWDSGPMWRITLASLTVGGISVHLHTCTITCVIFEAIFYFTLSLVKAPWHCISFTHLHTHALTHSHTGGELLYTDHVSGPVVWLVGLYLETLPFLMWQCCCI